MQGARSVLQHRQKQVPALSRWLAQLLGRTHQNVVIVALANKLVRMAWAVLCKNECYRAPVLAGDPLKSLFREKQFLPGLLAENSDGNGSLPRSRNLISVKVSSETVQFIGTRASGYPSWPGVSDSTKGRIHLRRPPLPSFVFRLQLCGGPYIPIIPASSTGRCNTF